MTATCGAARHTVLLVDDEPALLNILKGILESEGLTVLAVGDGQAAWDLLADVVPCLALVDVNMPGINGLELCRRMRDEPRLAEVPVVFVSAQISPADVTAGIAAGGRDYIKKPFDQETVRFRVRAHLRLHEARLAEQGLRERLAVISRAARDAIILMDSQGAIAHWNEAAEAMFGYQAAEALGRNLHQLIAPAPFQVMHAARYPTFQSTGQGDAIGQTVELAALRRSGEEFPIELSLSATQVDGAWWALGIVRDISARKRAEERYRTLFESSHDALMTLAPPAWQFTSANPAAVSLFGAASVAEFVSRGPWEYSPATQPGGGSSQEEAMQRIHEAMAQGRAAFGWTHRDLAGREFQAQVSLSRIGLDGESCLLATVRDTTEHQQQELALQQARKLEAVGQLAAGIAHEINTPTQYVSDSVQFLSEAFAAVEAFLADWNQTAATQPLTAEQTSRLRDLAQSLDLPFLMQHVGPSLERCVDGLSRVANIVRAMKEFAHPDQREKTPLDLNRAIENTLVIARNEYKYVADVETCFGELPLVDGHAGDLNQVLLNLIVNAAHAIEEVVGESSARGAIRISTACDHDSVRIEVADTGCGIPPAIRDRIFDPFFTTKTVGRGSGQGLAIARSIVVDKHSGSLTLESSVGSGTTFTIRLPVHASAPHHANLGTRQEILP